MQILQSFTVTLSNPDYGGKPVLQCVDQNGKRFGVPPGIQCEIGDQIIIARQRETGTMENDVAQFATGAKRGTDHVDCDMSLIPPEAMRAWGRAFAEGRAKYGTHNWLKGFPQLSLINHALQHIFSYVEGDRSEDHLGHALWNIGAAIHQQVHRPDLMDLPPYHMTSTAEQEGD